MFEVDVKKRDRGEKGRREGDQLRFGVLIYTTRTVGATCPLVLESGSPVFFVAASNPTPDGPLVLESGMSVISTHPPQEVDKMEFLGLIN